MSQQVFVLLSSNQQAAANLQAALTHLAAHCTILRLSPVYESAPLGAQYHDPFLDAVVLLESTLQPLAFREEVLRPIEAALGRTRAAAQQGHIPIDLDLLLWGDAVFEYGEKPWRVPDPGILTQIHLAQPLADLAPTMRHPSDGRDFKSISAALPREGLTPRPDIILHWA